MVLHPAVFFTMLSVAFYQYYIWCKQSNYLQITVGEAGRSYSPQLFSPFLLLWFCSLQFNSTVSSRFHRNSDTSMYANDPAPCSRQTKLATSEIKNLAATTRYFSVEMVGARTLTFIRRPEKGVQLGDNVALYLLTVKMVSLKHVNSFLRR